jgi:hypothetical protein
MTDEPKTEPLPLMSDEDIVRYARGVITNEYMLANPAQDQDWQHSLMLLLSGWKDIPSNASTLFLVPMRDHEGGRWLNGRVPGVTLSAVCVPIENADALIAKCDEFWKVLNPGAAGPEPEVRVDET